VIGVLTESPPKEGAKDKKMYESGKKKPGFFQREVSKGSSDNRMDSAGMVK